MNNRQYFIQKSETKRIAIERKSINGSFYIEFRIFYLQDNKWSPSEKAITISINVVVQFLTAINDIYVSIEHRKRGF